MSSNTPPLPRRKWGSLKQPVVVGQKIEKAARDRMKDIARNANVSAAVMLEFLIMNAPLTDQGIPVGWPEQDRDGELEMPPPQ